MVVLGQVEEDVLVAVVAQLEDILPGAAGEQHVAEAQRLVGETGGQGGALAADGQHLAAEARMKADLAHRLADQVGLGREHHLAHAHRLEEFALQGRVHLQLHSLELEPLGEPVDGLVLGDHHQDVVGQEDGFRPGRDKGAAAVGHGVQGDQVDAVAGAELHARHRTVDQARARGDAEHPDPLADVVALEDLPDGALPPPTDRALAAGEQVAAGHHHETDGQHQHGETERGEAEEAQGLLAMAAQGVVDDDVRGGGHQRHHAADERGRGQGDEQAAVVEARFLRHCQGDGDEDGGRGGTAHERADQGRAGHEQDEQPNLARAAAVDDGLAHALGQAGVDNGLADHKHGGDDHHHRAGQAGEGIAGFKHAGEHEGEHDQHRDQVAADPVGDEQHRRTRQGEDGNEHIRIVHKRLS